MKLFTEKIFFIPLLLFFIVGNATNYSFAQSKSLSTESNELIEKAKNFRKAAKNDSAYLYINRAVNEAIAAENCYEYCKATYWRGSFYYSEGKNDEALADLLLCSSYAEKCEEWDLFAASNIMIGEITGTALNDRAKAKSYFRKSLTVYKELNDPEGTASAYNELGLYSANPDSSLHYHRLSLKIDKEIKNDDGIADSYHNIATTHKDQGMLDSAYFYFLKTLEIDKKNQDVYNTLYTKNSIGEVLYLDKNYNVSLYYFKDVVKTGTPYNYKNQLQFAFKYMALIYNELEQYDSAFHYQKLFTDFKDSLMNEKTARSITEMETKYQTEKKELENLALSEKNSRQELELEHEKKTIYYLIIGLALAAFLIIKTFVSYRRKKRLNLQLEKQNLVLNEQKALIEIKNTEILDSITYAKRIQAAILPPLEKVKKNLPDSFILYLPKDIVAGDFYWMEELSDSVLIAAADCTGHGVPGAMVSVVCNNALNRSVREFGLTDPGEILNKTKEIVIEEFASSNDFVKDGMDIALVAINQKTKIENENEEKNTVSHSVLKYAGAHNPLWIIRKGAHEIEEIKANKQPIGHYTHDQKFTTHEVSLNKGDRIYLFSDGFADQFGGENGKKYKSKRFKSTLLSLSDTKIKAQESALQKEFLDWKGKAEQLDDICVIGLEV